MTTKTASQHYQSVNADRVVSDVGRRGSEVNDRRSARTSSGICAYVSHHVMSTLPLLCRRRIKVNVGDVGLKLSYLSTAHLHTQLLSSYTSASLHHHENNSSSMSKSMSVTWTGLKLSYLSITHLDTQLLSSYRPAPLHHFITMTTTAAACQSQCR